MSKKEKSRMSSPTSPADVLKSLQSEFRRHVVAKAIAQEARIVEIIPPCVESDIINARERSIANDHLFEHIRWQATVEDLRNLCSIMKEAKGYSSMNGFGKKLEAELDVIFPHQEEAATDGRLMQQPRCGHCGAKSGAVALPAENITSFVGCKEVQEVVAKEECDSLHSLAEKFVVTIGHIIASLSKENAEYVLDALKMTALAKRDLELEGSLKAIKEEEINDAQSYRELFHLLHIHRNWVDISLLEQLVEASESTATAAILAKYRISHESVISKALARQVDPSTDSTCPQPDANSCILQIVFKREDMLLKEVLACKLFLYYRFGVRPETIEYLSSVIGNSLVVTWLVSRRTGLRIVNQCRSPPVLAALQEMEVIAVHLRYPGYSVEVNVNLVSSGDCPQMEDAKSSGDLKQVQELTEKGVDMNEGHIMDEPSDVRRAPLSLAIKEGHEDLALELLSAGVDIHVKDDDGRTALHWACEKGLEEVVEALKSLGSHVDERDMFGLTPVMLAADSSKTAIPLHLVRAGASCKGVSVDHMNTLFRHACCEAQSDLTAVQKLLEEGCSVGILSKEEQEELLLHACHKGDMLVVESLIGHGCTVSCVSVDGYTPLMLAAQEGHEDVVKMLILAGANVGMRDKCGNTALHYAADHTRLACGILLAEGGASVRTKNSSSQTPLDLASAEFRSAIKEALIFTARKSICVIGNAKSGKSTLIAALQAERNSLFGKIANRFRRVSDRRQRTAGIETVFHSSRRYGEVLFFDFAGQDDYHGPHRMFLESLLSKPGVSMTLLLVVKMTEEEDAILHQLHRWLSSVALMATPASPPHVIIIGSFLDKMNSQEEATVLLARCIEAARRDLVELSPGIVGTSFLNCRQPQSTGINQICKYLQEIPIPEFRATHTRYSLAWVLSQIRSSFTAQAVQLKEFSKWLQDNKDNLPQTMPPPEEVCQDLMVVGHALYLPNREDPPKSWLVLDLPSILHDIYGTLFSQYREIVNKVGLLHYHHLAELFPCMDVGMVQQLLISLEFCLPVDPSILKVELSRLTQSKETSGWLFFPALISAKPSQSTLKGFSQQSVHYLCWQLRTSKKHSISARLLQTILFRLAAHFVVKQHNEDGVLQHCCSFWWNGITWQSTECTDISVHITNNRVIQVVGAGHTSADKLCQYLTNVINDILSTVHWLSPKLAAGAYIVYPPMIVTSPEAITAPPQERLFPMEGIHSSIRDHKEFALSLQDSENRCNTMPIADLFGGCSLSLEDIERISWPQPDHWSFTIGSGVRRVAKGISALTGSQMIPYGAQTLLDVSSTPDMPDVVKLVVTEVAADWQRVALRLGVEGWLSEAVLKSHPNDCEGACQDILNHWLRRDPHTGEEERTWSTLLIALGRAGFEELERSLRREHFHKTVC